MTPTHSEGMAAAQADYDAALVAFRAAQATLVATKAALAPFLEEQERRAKAQRMGRAAEAVQAWLEGASEKDAAVIAGYLTPNGFDSAKYRLIREFAPDVYTEHDYDDCKVAGEWSYAAHQALEKRQASVALERYRDANP